jgi:hypothetical protein
VKFNTNTIIVIAIGMLLAIWIAAVVRIEPAVWPGAHSASPSVTHP